MANKKVSQLVSKPSVLVTDLFPIADPTTGQLFKTTISDLGTAIGSGVSSVNTLVGAVVLDTDDIQELASPTNRWFTDTRARAALSASSPLAYNSGTGVFSIPQANGSTNGFLSSTDWTTFNAKQAALSGTGFVKISGTTISYDNSTYLTTSAAASTYLALAGGTLTGALNGTSATFTGDLTLSASNPRLYFTDTDNNPDYFISNTDGTFTIYDVTNSASRLTITSSLIQPRLPIVSTGTIQGTAIYSESFFSATTFVTANNYFLTGMTSGSGALYYSSGSNRVTVANYNANGILTFEVASGATSLTLNANLSATFASGIAATSATFSGGITATTGGFSNTVTATSISSVFKEGFIVQASTTGGGGSQPAYTYYTAAGSKRWSTFLNVGDDKFHIAGSANSELFTIQQNGNIGISNTSPGRPLTVQGQDDGNLQIRMQGTASTTSYAEIGRESSSTGDFRINLSRNGTVINPLKISDTTGAATFSNSITAPSGINALGQQRAFSWQRTSGTPSDVYSLNADSGSAYLQNDTTTGVLMTWLEGGSVGIGTTAPTDGKLVVEGSDVGITAKSTSNVSVFRLINTSGTSALVQVSSNLIFNHLGGDRMTIKSNGVVNIANVPTSSAGLSSGDIYKSAGVLMIV